MEHDQNIIKAKMDAIEYLLKNNKFDQKYLVLAHNKDYLNNINIAFPKHGLNFLDGDTIVSPGSKNASLDAVGSIITAIDGVM